MLFSQFRLILFLLFALLSWLPDAQAAPPPSFTLEQAFEIAIQNNPDYQATMAKSALRDAEIRTAATRLNPGFLSDNGVAEKTYRMGLEYTLETGGKRKNRVLVAQAHKEVTQAEIQGSLLKLRWQVRAAYTELYVAQKRATAYQEILHAAEQLLSIAQKREALGDVAKLDVLGARIASVTAQNNYQTALYQSIERRNQLAHLLYKPLDSQLALTKPPQQLADMLGENAPTIEPGQNRPPALQQKVLATLIQQAYQARPEMLQNQMQEQAVNRMLTLAHANRIPNVRISMGPDLVMESGQRKLGVFVVGAMELPVFDRQQGPIQEALARKNELALSREALKNDITFEILSAHTSLVANHERMNRYETQLLPDSEQVIRLAVLSFREGKAPIFLPLQAQQAYENTRLGYLDAVQGYQNAISDLEKAVGAGL